MAGRPQRKARLEAEARECGRKRFDDVAKRAALQRIAEVGSQQVAAELGVSQSTLRSWRKRLGGKEPSVAVQEPSADCELQADAGRLRKRAASRRAAQQRAEGAAEAFLARGQASEGRNSMVAAGLLADRGRELEQAAREEEQHHAALATIGGEQVIAMLTSVFDGLGLSVPVALVQTVLRGEQASAEAKLQARRELGLEERVEVLVPPMPDLGTNVLAEDPDEHEPEPVDSEPVGDAEAGTEALTEREIASAEREIRQRFPGAAADEEWLQRSLEQWREREKSRRARAAADGALVPTEQQLEAYLRTYVDPRTAEAMWRQDRREGRRLDRGSAAGRPT